MLITVVLFGVVTADTGHAVMPQSSRLTSTTSTGASAITVVNKDQFQGKWKQFKGDLKRKWGKFTDDDLLVIEGRYDKFEGKLQERYGDRKEEVQRWTDEWFEKNGKRSG